MAKGDFIEISIGGGRELARAMRELPRVAGTRVVRKAITKAMRPVRREVLARTPVLTGALKRGIKTRAFKAARRSFIIGRVLLFPTREDLGIAADDPYYYPAAVEYGHDSVEGVNFLRGGFDAAEGEALQILTREIGIGIEREAKKLAR